MLAVAVAAGLLALPPVLDLVLIALSIPLLALAASQWLVSRRHRRLAGFGFWAMASLTNLLAIFFCIAPNPGSYELLIVGLPVVAIPTTVTLGKAWFRLLRHDQATPECSREAAGFLVFFSAALPILTLWTLWPLYFAFLASKPALEQLAAQVATGRTVVLPQRAGVFRVIASAVDPIYRYPGLMTDKHWRPTGFVRLPRDTRRNTHGPIVGVHFDVYLGGGWWYRG